MTPTTEAFENREKREKVKLVLLSFLSLIGASLAVYLALHFYELRNGTQSFRSLCSINSTFDCDAVTASPASELLPGIPLASFVAGWFFATFALSLIARIFLWRAQAVRTLFAMYSVGLLFSVTYLAVMVQMKAYCLFCLVIDAVLLVSWAISLSLKPRSLKALPFDPDQMKSFVALTAGILFVSVVLLKSVESRGLSAQEIREIVDSTLQSSPVAIQTSGSQLRMGPSSAPITIVEFSDFQCPYCKLGAQSMHSVLKRYPKQLQVILKPFPLDSSCNRSMQRSAHAAACESAFAVYCAAQLGLYVPAYERLFDQQSQLAPGRILGIVGTLASETQSAALSQCIAAPETRAAIEKEIEEGLQLGVQSTPTFFINGRKVLGMLAPPVWFELVDSLLKNQEQK